MNKRIENKGRVILYVSVFFFVLYVIAYNVFANNIKNIKLVDISKIKTGNDNYNIEMKYNDDANFIKINGFVAKENTNINSSSIYMVLSSDSNEYYKIPTYVKYIEENNNVDNNGWNGFVSYIDKNDLKHSGVYSVYLLVDFNDCEELVNAKEAIEIK